MNRTLNVLSFLIFSSALNVRAIDPVVPRIAEDFAVLPTTAALLAAAFAAYGLAQPFLGPMADAFGKSRTMVACLLVLAISSFLSSVVTSFWLLFVLRIVAGAACGGSFPVGEGGSVDVAFTAASRRVEAAGFKGDLLLQRRRVAVKPA